MLLKFLFKPEDIGRKENISKFSFFVNPMCRSCLLSYTLFVLIVTNNSFSKNLRGDKWDKNNAEEGAAAPVALPLVTCLFTVVFYQCTIINKSSKSSKASYTLGSCQMF